MRRNDDILSNVLAANIKSNNIESSWLDLLIKNQRILIGCIYRQPTDNKFITNFDQLMDSICMKRKNLILIGDFNYDLSNQLDNLSNQARNFRNILYMHNLVNIIEKPTRVTDVSSTTIDLIITSQNPVGPKITKSGTHSPGISDHDLIYTVLELAKPRRTPTLIKKRKCLNERELLNTFENFPWQVLNVFDDVNDTLYFWEKSYHEICNMYIKESTLKIRSQSKPWINTEIRKNLNKRFKLLLKARKTAKPSTEWKKYREQRNLCTNLIRKAESNYWQEKFSNTNSVKSFWKIVAEYQGKKTHKQIGTLLDSSNNPITHDTNKANLLNAYYSTVGEKMQSIEIDKSNKQIYRITPTCSTIDLSYSLYKRAFSTAIKPEKAPGSDCISPKLLKSVGPECGLYSVIKQSISQGCFPDSWKIGKVTCIYKKGSHSKPENYRPITLLSVASKVLEKIILTSLQTHITNHNLISEHQWGFRSGRSTESILLHMTEKWNKALDEGKVIGVLFVDFKKAFDCVPHDVLFKKLQAQGITGDFYNTLKSYLDKRHQFTTVNSCKSNLEPVKNGVPQGSLLGPQLFSSDVNDLPDDLTESETDMFADDTTSYSIRESHQEAFKAVQTTLVEIQDWSLRNGFGIHTSVGKTEIMFISKKRFIGPLPNFTLKGESIEVSSRVKCLGLTIDNNLTWSDHVLNSMKNFRSKLKKLLQMRYLHHSSLKEIYFKGILPSVLYGIAIWGGCSTHLMEKVNEIHIKAARFICKIKKRVPSPQVLDKAGWHKLDWYYKRRVLCITHQLYHNDSCLSSLVQKRTERRSLRNNLVVTQPSFRYVKYKLSFRYRAAILWNNIQDCVKNKRYDDFKVFIKNNSHILNNISIEKDYSGKIIIR